MSRDVVLLLDGDRDSGQRAVVAGSAGVEGVGLGESLLRPDDREGANLAVARGDPRERLLHGIPGRMPPAADRFGRLDRGRDGRDLLAHGVGWRSWTAMTWPVTVT